MRIRRWNYTSYTHQVLVHHRSVLVEYWHTYFFEAEEREGIEKGRSLFLNCSVAMINWDIQSDQYQSEYNNSRQQQDYYQDYL